MTECKRILTPENVGFDISSSDVKHYDGTTLVDIVLPANPTLNDVVKAIDDEFVDHQTQIDAVASPVTKTSEITDWDGTSTFSCFTLTPNATLNAIIDEIGVAICVNKTLIEALVATEIAYTTLTLNVDPYTVGAAVTNVDEAIAAIDSAIQVFADPDTGKVNVVDEIEKWNEAVSNFVMSGANVTGIGTLSLEIATAIYMKDGKTTPKGVISKTVITLKDIYLTFKFSTLNYIVTSVANGAPQPAIPSGEIIIAKAVTDATDIISIDNIQDVAAIGSKNLKDNAIASNHIPDDTIVFDKLVDSGVTAGVYPFSNITVTAKGIITSVVSDVNFTALADGDFMKYDNASSKWLNVEINGGIFPSGATDQDVLTWDNASSLWIAQASIAFTAIPLAGTTSAITGNLEVTTGVKTYVGTTDITWNTAGVEIHGDSLSVVTTNMQITSELALSGEVHFPDIGTPPAVPVSNEIIVYADDISGVAGTVSLFLLSEDDTKIVLGTRIGFGTHTPATSAMLEVQSTTKGLLFPRMNNTQRDAIPSPVAGLVIFSTTDAVLQFHNGSAWGNV